MIKIKPKGVFNVNNFAHLLEAGVAAGYIYGLRKYEVPIPEIKVPAWQLYGSSVCLGPLAVVLPFVPFYFLEKLNSRYYDSRRRQSYPCSTDFKRSIRKKELLNIHHINCKYADTMCGRNREWLKERSGEKVRRLDRDGIEILGKFSKTLEGGGVDPLMKHCWSIYMDRFFLNGPRFPTNVRVGRKYHPMHLGGGYENMFGLYDLTDINMICSQGTYSGEIDIDHDIPGFEIGTTPKLAEELFGITEKSGRYEVDEIWINKRGETPQDRLQDWFLRRFPERFRGNVFYRMFADVYSRPEG